MKSNLEKSILEKEDGFSVLPASLFVATAIAIMFMFASSKTEDLIRRYWVAQANMNAQDLAAKLAQKVRWSYDIAFADTTSPGLCASHGGTVETIGALRLCLVANQICAEHPRDAHLVCISSSDSTLIAKAKSNPNFFVQLFFPEARAADLSAPDLPPAGETSNSLAGLPTCVGGACGATCSVDADCLTFRFCPLLEGSTCTDDEFVWQTVALLK